MANGKKTHFEMAQGGEIIKVGNRNKEKKERK